MYSHHCRGQRLSHLEALESESIHILREVAAECRNPALLFSGGKDSLVLLRLAEKAFRPGRFPFPLLHIDTEHNFPEVIEFRDRRAAELSEQLFVRFVQNSIDQGRVVLCSPDESRNVHQSVLCLIKYLRRVSSASADTRVKLKFFNRIEQHPKRQSVAHTHRASHRHRYFTADRRAQEPADERSRPGRHQRAAAFGGR